MTKTILILADGMADEPIEELGGRTPVEFASTPNMDWIAREGASGTFLSLPEGFPTSSDVANMSVMGYDPGKYYTGRGPLEAVSQGIEMDTDDIAWRCNLINVQNKTLIDYSAGHIEEIDARKLIEDLGNEFNYSDYTFHSGVSYRNLFMLHGKKFSDNIAYEKPDDSQGKKIDGLMLKPNDNSVSARETANLLNELMRNTADFLGNHPINKHRNIPANMIWLWSPGTQPQLPKFHDKYHKTTGAVISAVDVIFGLGKCAGMDIVKVEGATGFIDTNYEGKAAAAVKALKDHDFVYLHIEAPDECSHMGDLQLKLKSIEDIDQRVIARLREDLEGEDVTIALLPDHPVPIRLRVHTRTPVPFAIRGVHIERDACQSYSEQEACKGALGLLKGDELMRLILNL